jgi:predicted RNase H-like nuclease (RuvC/YqgF family)
MEPVEDVGKEGHSIFAYYFLKTLKDNPHPYLSAKQLGVQVEELVTRNSIQTPISKFIHGVGDEGGQFFFINRKSGTPKVSPGPITTKAQDSTELQKEIKRLEQERLGLERLKVEIESKKLEAERKRLEAEKKQLEMELQKKREAEQLRVEKARQAEERRRLEREKKKKKKRKTIFIPPTF